MNIKPRDIKDNVFKLIGKDWMLITAGDRHSCNTMTASFGGFGVLFAKDVAHIYVRPERYTYEFLEKADTFSLSFFDESFRKKLNLCGSRSGRDTNKISDCGFDVLISDNETPYFEQARMTVFCKKIYRQDIAKECFTDLSAYNSTYASGGMHRMYIGEITNIIIK